MKYFLKFKYFISLFLLLSLSMPYISKTSSLRIDHLFILLPLFAILSLAKTPSVYTRKYFIILLIYIFFLIRLLFNLTLNRDFFQLGIQYSYYLTAYAYLIIFNEDIRKNTDTYIKIFKIIIFYISIYSIIQFIFRDSSLVSIITEYYSGNVDKNVMSKVEISLTNLRASSIFVQPSSNGLYSIIAFFYMYMLYQIDKTKITKILYIISIISGMLSATKTFLFAFLILFPLLKLIENPVKFIKNILLYIFYLLVLIYIGYLTIPYIKKVIDWFFNFGISYFFKARFSSVNGWLANDYTVINDNIITGIGINVFKYRYADSMPLMLIMLGGVFFIILSYIQYLLTINYSKIFFYERMALLFVIILISTSFPAFIQARIIIFYILIDNILIIYCKNKVREKDENHTYIIR